MKLKYKSVSATCDGEPNNKNNKHLRLINEIIKDSHNSIRLKV